MQNEDPRLTAYALGELEPSERADVEALLKNNPAAAQEVAEMRELAALVRRHLSTEDAPPLAPQQRDDILSEMNGPQVIVMPRNERSGAPRRVWLPVAIAACAAVLAGSSVLYYEEHKPRNTTALHKEGAEIEGVDESGLAADQDAKREALGLNFNGGAAPMPATPAAAAAPVVIANPPAVSDVERQAASAPNKRLVLASSAPPAPSVSLAGAAVTLNPRDAQLRAEVTKGLKEVAALGSQGTDRISGLAEVDNKLRQDRALQAPRPNVPAEQLVGNAGGAFSGAITYGSPVAGDPQPANEKAKNQAAAPDSAKAAGAKMPVAMAPLSDPAPEAKLESKYSRHAYVVPTLGDKPSSSGQPDGNATSGGGGRGLPGEVVILNRNGAPKNGAVAGGRASGVASPALPAGDVSGNDKGNSLATDVDPAARRFGASSAPVPGLAPATVPPAAGLAENRTMLFKDATKGGKAAVDAPSTPVGTAAAPQRKAMDSPTATAARDGSGLALDAGKLALNGERDELRSKLTQEEVVNGVRMRPTKELEKLAAAAPDEAAPRTFTPLTKDMPLQSRTTPAAPEPELLPAPAETFNTDSYDTVTDNPFLQVLVRGNETSTFSIDVDTASYANVRRILTAGQRPPRGAVRIEELVNYFKYDYPEPKAGDPLSVRMDVAACPWTPEHRLLRVGLKARDLDPEKRPRANLIFLIDVSGSMDEENKLPLVKKSLRLLVEKLGAQDSVGIVVYAGASGTVLEPTNEKKDILAAIDRLSAGGSTNGGSGIQLAYKLAMNRFEKGRTNRVILATDGDFNVGVTNQSDLVALIEKQAKSGVFLTVLGFGYGNLKDSTMEKLADKGNGNYGYIDTIAEGRKMLVEQMAGTLVTVAKDVKLQIEFNPAQVGAYRLIGYENRLLAKEDFNDDTKDAGEIGAGHTVTALYELVPAGQPIPGERETTQVDPLKYQPNPIAPGNKVAQASVDASRYDLGRNNRGTSSELAETKIPADELLTLKLRWKAPDADVSTKREFPLTDPGLTLEKSPQDFRWAAAVAEFGMILRDSPYKGQATWSNVRELAVQGQGKDADSHRIEFLELIGKAEAVAR